MPIQVEQDGFDLRHGFRYYVSFKPHALDDVGDYARVPVDVALSVCENGDLADMTFEVPKYCRTDRALAFIQQQEEASYVTPRVFVARQGVNGDAVVNGLGHLELDVAGRIVGIEIQWAPTRGATA